MQNLPETTKPVEATGQVVPVIVCADDFGMEPSVDEGIVELSRLGRLSATSCLVDAPEFAQSAATLKDLPIDLGLHLNFTESLGLPGLFLPHGKLVALAYTRRLHVAGVRRQIDSQLDRFERHVGRAPDFVDGHLHVHQLPVIREALVDALVRRYPKARPWLRNTTPGTLDPALPFMQRFKPRVIAALGAAPLFKLASLAHFKFNSGFLGVYDFERSHPPYPVLLDAWLRHATPGMLLMTHPAKRFARGVAFGTDRVEEYRTLSGEIFAALLATYHLKVSRMTTLAEP